MPKRLAAVALLIAVGSAGCSTRLTGSEPAPRPAAQAPIQLPAEIAEHWAGKVVIIDFWATWCKPCLASSPNVQILHDTFAPDDGVLVVAVHADDNVQDPGAYLTEHGYTYPLIARGETIADAFGVHALPTFVILDPQGREAYRHLGMMSERTRKTIEAQARALRG